MSRRNRNGSEGASDAPREPASLADGFELKRPRLGDIVIYAHRRPTVGADGRDYAEIPLLVTQVLHDGTSVNGVVFDASLAHTSTGSKAVRDIPMGKGGGTWRHP